MISDRLSALKQQRELEAKPFPLKALLHLYETGSSRDLYINHMEGFKELVTWLSPIEIPDYPPVHIPKIHNSYDLQQIAAILQVPPYKVYQSWTSA